MSKIKEIWCLHHSHLDVGYTHPQNMLLELQRDYIDQAVDLCVQTREWPEESRYRWTCEATYPVLKWFECATDERKKLFRKLVQEGYISVTALPMHTTPNCTDFQMIQYLQHLDRIRKMTGSEIKTAINHDINGQPWTMASLLLDSNIEFYITGINIHFGGIPFPRPYVFRWQTPDNRVLPSFVGEHYSLFSQLFFTDQGSTEKMHEGVREYVSRLEKSNWNEDYAYLTATNPPLMDNNCPDANLAEMVRKYNEEGHEQIIRFVTPEMLYERVKQSGVDTLDVHAGDWTDYWNFGCASAAREQKINKHAKKLLFQNDFLNFSNNGKLGKNVEHITEKAYEQALLFDEHTWGACDCVTEPDEEETYAQLNHKKEFAYTAADLSAYLVSQQMEYMAQNPKQADKQEGILLVNPTGVTLHHEVKITTDMKEQSRTLAALRMKDYLPYEKNKPNYEIWGNIEIPPFTAKRIPLSSLKKADEVQRRCVVEESFIDTPFYHITRNEKTGHILQIKEKKTGRELLNEGSQWGFFDVIEEHVDPRYALLEREAIFPRDIDKGNHSITQWKHDWKAVREGIQREDQFGVEEKKESIVLWFRSESRSLKNIEQKITFSMVYPEIKLDITFEKMPILEPEGIYFAFPLKLHKDWQCVYDTEGTFVKLDEEQLGTVCRDYITVDKTISLFDECGGYTLACPDAPIVQVGDFQFGKENKCIRREENPLLLAWPMNNYWNTNFPASQDGKITFHYELSLFEKFDRMSAYGAGLQAGSYCVQGAIVECEESEERQFLRYESESSVPAFVRTGSELGEWLIAIRNFSTQMGGGKLSIPGRKLLRVAVTDIQGNEKEELSLTDNWVEITENAQALTFLKVKLKDSVK